MGCMGSAYEKPDELDELDEFEFSGRTLLLKSDQAAVAHLHHHDAARTRDTHYEKHLSSHVRSASIFDLDARLDAE